MEQNLNNRLDCLFKHFDPSLVNSQSFLDLFILLVYFPIGICLLVIRLVLLTVLGLLAVLFPQLKQSPYFIRYVCISFGLHTKLQNQKLTDSIQLFISNHITCFDFLSLKSVVYNLNFIQECQSVIYESKSIFNSIVNFYLSILQFKKANNEDFYQTKSNYPCLYFPEQTCTNGKCYLLKFDLFPFDLENVQTIQPVCLKVTRPLLPLSVNYVFTNDFLNFLLTLFCPITFYNVFFLDLQYKKDLATSELFAQHVRQLIASKLELQMSESSFMDLKHIWLDYKKELNAAPKVNLLNRNSSSMSFSDISKLALQIKEILPHVSYDIIQQHIRNSSTLDIDTVIESILDSTNSTEPLQQDSELLPQFSRSISTPTVVNNSKPTFQTSKSVIQLETKPKPVNQFKSYEERKFDLLNEARKRYLAKNPVFY